MKKTKVFPFLALALIPFLFLAMEALVLLIESLFYGTTELQNLQVSAMLIHWGCTCVIWIVGIGVSYKLSKRMGYSPFLQADKPKTKGILLAVLLIALSTAMSFVAWEMRLKPAVEFASMVRLFGNRGPVAFMGQYVYYLCESALFLSIVVYGQKFGEMLFKKDKIPWGGILCGLTWGLGHILTQDFFTGLYSLVGAILYGIAYMLLNKNIRYTYPAVALMFML